MSLKFLFQLDRNLGVALILGFSLLGRLLGMILRRDHSLRVRGDILVIKMVGGGSLVMAFPALLGIRRTYPDVKMRLFTTVSVQPFAETLGIFDEILCVESKSIFSLAAGTARCIRKTFGSDTVIDLEVYSYLSTVLSLLTCARNRIGYFFEEMGFRQRLHTHRIFFHPGSPLYLHYDRTAEILEAPLASPEECSRQIKKVLGIEHIKPSSMIAVGCGCSSLADERKLVPRQWAENVFAPAAGKDRPVIFLGIRSDRPDAEKAIAAIKSLDSGGWAGPIKNACGDTPLADSLRIMARCEEFWGIESSLLHYARLFGLRCKSFLGPTHPRRLRPMAGLAEEVFYRKTVCSPCIHLVSTPPCHGNNLCMQWLFEKPEKQDPREHWIPVTTE